MRANNRSKSTIRNWPQRKNKKTLIDKFEIQKLGFLIASTDELGYGTDYGDFLMGIHYDGEDIDFEYSGGVGVVELLDAE